MNTLLNLVERSQEEWKLFELQMSEPTSYQTL